MCPENEICAAPIGICQHIRVVLLDLFYHCRGCLVTGMPSLIGLSWEKEYPLLTVRACDGLSWDTPAGIELSKAMPAVMGRWEFVNVQLDNLNLNLTKMNQPCELP